MCFIPFCVCIVTLNIYSAGVIQEKVDDHLNRSFEYAANNVNMQIENYNKMANHIMFNKELQQKILLLENGSSSDYYTGYNDIAEILMNKLIFKEGVLDINLIDKNYKTIYSSFERGEAEGFGNSGIMDPAGQIAWYPGYKDTPPNYDFSIFINIKSLVTDYKNLGFIKIKFDERYLHRRYKEIVVDKDSRIYIVDEKNKIVSSNDDDEKGRPDKFSINNEFESDLKDKNMLFYKELINGWVIKYHASNKEIYRSLHSLNITSRDSYIIRLYNPTDKAIKGEIRFTLPIMKVYLTNLNEVRQYEMQINEDGIIKIIVGANKIITLDCLNLF